MDQIEDERDRAAIVHAARAFFRLYGDVFRSLPLPQAAPLTAAQAATGTPRRLLPGTPRRQRPPRPGHWHEGRPRRVCCSPVPAADSAG